MNLSQSEAGALPRLLRREERLKGLGDLIRRHADASIRHGDQHILPGWDIDMQLGVAIIKVGVRCFDRKLASFRHGVACIRREIKERAFKLALIGVCGPQSARQNGFELYIGAKRSPKDFGHILYETVGARAVPGQVESAAIPMTMEI